MLGHAQIASAKTRRQQLHPGLSLPHSLQADARKMDSGVLPGVPQAGHGKNAPRGTRPTRVRPGRGCLSGSVSRGSPGVCIPGKGRSPGSPAGAAQRLPLPGSGGGAARCAPQPQLERSPPAGRGRTGSLSLGWEGKQEPPAAALSAWAEDSEKKRESNPTFRETPDTGHRGALPPIVRCPS